MFNLSSNEAVFYKVVPKVELNINKRLLKNGFDVVLSNWFEKWYNLMYSNFINTFALRRDKLS